MKITDFQAFFFLSKRRQVVEIKLLDLTKVKALMRLIVLSVDMVYIILDTRSIPEK